MPRFPTTCGASSIATAPARDYFEMLDSANRYAILYRLDEAKKPETPERRLRKFVTMLERGETIH